jgi:eukaryotic-like serine/threonine-protein kinase
LPGGEHASEQPHTARKITRPGAFSPAPPSGGPPPLLSPTLSDIGAQETQAGPPGFGGHPVPRRPGARPPRSAWKRIGAGLAVVAAMTAAGLAGWQADLTGAATPHTAAAARHPAPQSPPMVLVSRASLVGQQAGVVVTDLRRLGLRPRLARVPTRAQPPDTVLTVQPRGALPPGTVVTVTIAAQPAQQGGQTGDGGDGDGGNGGGNGGNDGGGSGGGGNGD